MYTVGIVWNFPNSIAIVGCRYDTNEISKYFAQICECSQVLEYSGESLYVRFYVIWIYAYQSNVRGVLKSPFRIIIDGSAYILFHVVGATSCGEFRRVATTLSTNEVLDSSDTAQLNVASSELE